MSDKIRLIVSIASGRDAGENWPIGTNEHQAPQVKNKSNYEVVYYVHWLQTSSGDSGCLSRV